MSSDELRQLYIEAYKIIQQAPRGFPKERMLFLLAAIKDVAKTACYEQPTLIDAPKKVEYK